MFRFILILISVVNLISFMIIGAAGAGMVDRLKPKMEAMGLKLAVLKPSGCQSDAPVPMGINVEDGNVVGVVLPSRKDNPPEKSSPIKFKFEIRGDGTFGGEKGDENRFWLRPHSSGDSKYQWVSGTVTGSDIKIKMVFGSPGHSESFCEATGSITK